jgi:putative tributyrin esterase
MARAWLVILCAATAVLTACGQLPSVGPTPTPAPPYKDVHTPPEILRALPAPTPVPSAAPTRAVPATPIEATATPRPAVGGVPVGVSRPLAGMVRDDYFHSATINRDFVYRVYLPPTYLSEPERRYPVLYMLHGVGGDYTEWTDSFLPEVVDVLIQRGDVQPLIVVMPDGSTPHGSSYWANWDDDGPHWADYVADDVVHMVDARYRTLTAAASRAIGGLSMGGTAALSIAMNHPDEFGVAGAHSPSIRPDADPALWFITGDNYDEQNPVWLAENKPESASVRAWLDVGEDDIWRPNAELLRRTMLQHGFNVTWQVYPGEHEAQYWIEHLPDYLGWYSSALAEPSS